jgi:hypothetical protein
MSFETSRNCPDFPNGKIRLANLQIDQTGRNKMFLSGTLDMDVGLTKEFKVCNPLHLGLTAIQRRTSPRSVQTSTTS